MIHWLDRYKLAQGQSESLLCAFRPSPAVLPSETRTRDFPPSFDILCAGNSKRGLFSRPRVWPFPAAAAERPAAFGSRGRLAVDRNQVLSVSPPFAARPKMVVTAAL